MTSLVDLRFDPLVGDLVLSNGDLETVSDNEAIQQNAYLGLTLQIGFNQYYPDAGWNWMRFAKANLAPAEIQEIIRQIKVLVEEMDFVVAAVPTYLGFQPAGQSQFEHIFDVKITSTFGTISVPAALGGFNG